MKTFLQTRGRIVTALAVFVILLIPVSMQLATRLSWHQKFTIAQQIIPEELAILATTEVDDPVLHAYAYEKNQYEMIPSLQNRDLNVMQNRCLPVFRFAGCTYVVLHKDRNWSWGVVHGSPDPNTDGLSQFTFKSVRQDLEVWVLDLEK